MSDIISYAQPTDEVTGGLLHSFGLASLMIVLGVTATWFVIKRDEVPLSTGFSEQVILEVAVAPSVGENLTLLEQADLAFAAGRIIEPEYDNSLSYYTSLLEKEPENTTALEGIDRVKSYVLTQADSAMYQNDWNAARAYAKVIQSFDPDNAHAQQINNQSNQLESILKLRDLAVQRLSQGQLVTPKGASAVDSYRSILKLDPNNVVALEGIRSISQRLIARAQTAIFAGEVKDAGAMIAHVQRIDPAAPGLAETRKSASEWERVIKDRDVQKFLTQAAESLREDRLMRPSDNNAFDYFQRALKRAPDSNPAQRGIELVQNLLLDRAMERINADDLDGGKEAVTLASEAGASTEKLAPFAGELKHRKRLLDARAGIFDRTYALSELTNLYRVNPEYPLTASQRHKKGWVEVDFVVTENGNVRNARVLNSSRGLFERNALDAVSKWRFKPVIEDGRPVPINASVRFTFQ